MARFLHCACFAFFAVGALLSCRGASAADLHLLAWSTRPDSWAEDCSADGTVVVGRDSVGLWYWTPWNQQLRVGGGTIPAGGQSRITADGRRVLCQAPSVASGRTEVMLVDLVTLQLTDIGTCQPGCSTRPSTAWDMNRAGTVVVGMGNTNGAVTAFGWVAPMASPADLGTKYFYKTSRAAAVSEDGGLIAGWNEDYNGFWQGAVWTRGTDGTWTERLLTGGTGAGYHKLHDASAVSGDGRWVFGRGLNGYDGGAAWRWSASTGYEPLGGNPLGADIGSPVAANADGSKVLGFFGPGAALGEGYLWLAARGWVALEDYATEHGVQMPSGVHLALPLNMSEDGLTIVGTARGDAGFAPFILDLHTAAPCVGDLNGDHTVDGADLGILLGDWGGNTASDLNGDHVVDGADLGILLGAWGNCPQ
jgi:hypothetical protein